MQLFDKKITILFAYIDFFSYLCVGFWINVNIILKYN